MNSLLLDLRYSLRLLAKTPGLTAILAITLALGIGASTTIFSVVHSVLLRDLPYEQPDRIVRVYTEFHADNPASSFYKFPFSAPEVHELAEACRSCERVGGWLPGSASLAGGERPVRIQAAYATADLLPLLGVKPALGRWFDHAEDSPAPAPAGQIVGDPTVIVIGHDLWQRVFAGDPTIIGRQVHLDGIAVTVIGVMPAGFTFFDHDEAWVPARLDYGKLNRSSHGMNVVVRLRPDASVASLNAELAALAAQWAPRDAEKFHSLRPTHPMLAVPFKEDLVGSLATTLWLLQAAVLFVLLISIVNVANLLLARAETRNREVAVRHALGASKRRLVRQFITESLVLGGVGCGLGLLVSVWALDGVTALIPRSAPRASEIELDGGAVLFAIGCSFVAALLFGLAPILHARRSDLHGALKDGANRMTSARARLRARRMLVIAEIALAVVLVIGCTVMVRSFLRLQRVELGFEPDHTVSFGVQLPLKSYPGATPNVFWARLEQRLQALPGVESAGLIDSRYPARGVNAESIEFPDRSRPTDAGMAWNADYLQAVGPGALETMRVRLVAGRLIEARDSDYAPRVIVVNEAFARRFFPGSNPLGQRVTTFPTGDAATSKPATIVGVIADLKNAGVDRPAGTEIFMPRAQYGTVFEPPFGPLAPLTQFGIVRTHGDPTALMPAIHALVHEIDPNVPLYDVRTYDELMWEAVARPRFLTFLLVAFAVIALLLATVGIYGVMAHTVVQRTHEIGLRVALGAQPQQVRAMVLRQAASLVAAGIAIGLAAAIGLQLAFDRSLRGIFLGERLSQPVMLAGVAIAVAATAFIATWVPARRATRVEPTVALRSE